MAKKKYQINQSKRITIYIFINKGSEGYKSKQENVIVNSETIEYNYIKQICEEFLRDEAVDFQTNLYFVNTSNFNTYISIAPGFSLTTKYIIQVLEANLILVMQSAIDELRQAFTSQINNLKTEIQQLKFQIQILKKPLSLQLLRKNSIAPSPLMLHAHSYLSKNYSQIDNIDEIQLDIAILFSQPLYDEQKKKITSPPVDFRSQITRLHGALQNSFKPSIIMRCEIATFESLQTTIKYSKPKIMHIICHGNHQGNLQFEDDSRNTLGLLQLLKPADLKMLLKSSKQIVPELVFINSCHSEKVGRAFFDLGVPNVVMINSEDLISDEAAQIFSENFYRKIFKGSSISQAFDTSKSRVEQKYVGECCCTHSPVLQPHRENCEWYRMFKNEGSQAHRSYHVPKCDCEQKNKNIHSFKCQWAIKTLFEINKDFRIPQQKSDGTKQFRFPAHISEFPPYVDKLNKTLTICCCPPLEGKPHSESRKFVILSQDKQKVLMPVNHNREHPEIIDLTSAELLEAHEKSKAIFGRQRQLFEFLKNVQDTNFIYVYGKTGVGLTTFTIKASTYMMERRVFEFFFFFDLYDIKDITVFRYKFNQITKFQYNGKSVIDFGIKSKKILFLFDNCDSFIDQDLEKFYQEMQNLLRQFPKCKIIITFKQETRRNFDEKKVNETNLGYELHPFEDKPATFFLHGKMRYKADMSSGLKQFAKLVKKYEVLKIPKVVESLSQSIPITKKNVTLQEIEKSVEQIKLSDTNLLTKSVLDQLKEMHPEAYQFLVFCSLFSDGVSFEDINMFSCYFKPGMSIELPIRKNWEEHYMLLLEKQPKNQVTSSSSLPKLETSVSFNEQVNIHPEQRKIQMKKRESEQIPTPFSNKQLKGEFDKLDKIHSESYFIDRNGPNKFIVKRFIRDYLWKSHLNQTTNQTKFLFVAYFSVILQMLFETLKIENYIHEQLTTYSAISSAGIFKFKTTLKDIYGQRNLTESVRFAISFMSDLNDIFMNNEQLLEKMKKTDHSTFIMNHRQDFLKFYDTRWPDVYEHLIQRKKSQEKIFVILLQNLMIYIPTAFKIANAEESLLRYVIKRSEKELIRLRRYSEMQRNLKLLLKLYMIEVGICLENNPSELKDIFSKAFKQITDCNAELAPKKIKSLQIGDIKQIMQMQKFGCDLLLDELNLKMQKNDFQHINNKKIEFLTDNRQKTIIEPLIRAKQGYMISCLFLKFILDNKPELSMILKPFNQTLQNRNLQDVFGILNICESSIKIFEIKNCIKLKVRAELTSIQLFWAFNQKMKTNKKQLDTQEIEKWRKKLATCQMQYMNQKNKLKGFTQFDDKIKELNQKIKQKLWVSASRRLIFMKAYPLCSKQQPILKNLIRKKNNFRQEIQKVLVKAGRQQPDRMDRKIEQSPSARQLSPYTNHQERRQTLDISTKYEILTAGKISEQAKAKCSIMFINVDVKASADKVYLICENDIMQEQLVELNEELGANINMDNVFIVVFTGVNTRKAMWKINQFSNNPPIFICLESQPYETHSGIDFIHDLESQVIKQVIKRQNQIKKAELVYTKTFIQLVTSLEISKNEDIQYIHEKSSLKMMDKVKNCLVKAYIQLSKCRQNVCLKFNPGVYRDLSPGYEGNHNIDSRSYDSSVSIRRWKKMIQFFKFLNLKKPKKQSQNMNEEARKKNLFGPGYNKEQNQFYVDLPGIYINIYGESGCGKTYFIREIAKILIQREFYDFGVFLFEGKKIEKQFSGDFEAYIKKQASLGKMPVLDDFQRLLGDKTILIIDDFHLIRSRINARMKIFLDKVISRKVNLVLVSLIELKLDYLPIMKKIKLQSLDHFETQVLAYNIINIYSEDELLLYCKLKQKASKQNRYPTMKQIEGIDRNAKNLKKKGYTQKIIHNETSTEEAEVGNSRMRKSITSYEKQ